MEAFLHYIFDFLGTLPPVLIYVFVLFSSFIENIFPPFPSDVILVFLGTLTAKEAVNFTLVQTSATLGGSIGFMFMYYVGQYFSDKVVEAHKIPFLPLDKLHVAERWFQKYGYVLIIINRFLSGTRAIISFFAGMSGINKWITLALCTVSSFIWNYILIYWGRELGHNLDSVIVTIDKYSTLFTLAVTGSIILYVLWKVNNRKEKE